MRRRRIARSPTSSTSTACTGAAATSILFLRYGPAVTIERQEGDFYVVQAPIRGSALLSGKSATLTVNQSVGAVLSPRSRGVLEWSEHCEQILVKVPVRMVESVWRTVTGEPLQRLPEFQPALFLDSPAGAWFLHLVDCALRDGQLAEHSRAATVLARRLEELFVLKLLFAQPHTLSAEMSRGGASVAPKCVRLAEDYMRAHLHEPVSLLDLAGHARISVRSLNKVFHDFRQTSPMAMFRALRLEAARRDLIAASLDAPVSSIALRWGFNHLGRFAAHYRRRYGETPKATLRR